MPQPAPDFNLKAVASGRIISRTQVGGRPLLLLFHNQDGLETVRALQTAVRSRWPNPQTVLAASVVSLQAVPRLLRGMAQSMMGAAYREAASAVPAGLDPADYVLILPDGSGDVCRSFGIDDGGKVCTGVLIDGAWQLRARCSSPDLVAQIVVALEELLGAPLGPQQDGAHPNSQPRPPSGTIPPAA